VTFTGGKTVGDADCRGRSKRNRKLSEKIGKKGSELRIPERKGKEGNGYRETSRGGTTVKRDLEKKKREKDSRAC